MSHQLRFCKTDESPLLQEFLETSWKSGHVLTYDHTLLDWAYFNIKEDRYNFMVAANESTGKFDAILGFIPIAHFDPALACDNELWLSMWKNDVEKSKDPQIGLKLFRMVSKAHNNPPLGVLGATPVAERIYRALKFSTGPINNYYVMNPTLDSFTIVANAPEVSAKSQPSSYHIKELDLHDPSLTDIPTQFRPRKSLTFLRNRYTNHPRFTYKAYGIYKASTLENIWISRILTVENARCIRLVDMYGQLAKESLQHEIEKILITEDAEHIECSQAGLEASALTAMGFSLREDPMILPIYFDPFEQKNFDLIYSYRTASDDLQPYHMFKGDSDQDRPNR